MANIEYKDLSVFKAIKKIENPNSIVYKNGKNYYVEIANIIITINSYSYTIITAHIKK